MEIERRELPSSDEFQRWPPMGEAAVGGCLVVGQLVAAQGGIEWLSRQYRGGDGFCREGLKTVEQIGGLWCVSDQFRTKNRLSGGRTNHSVISDLFRRLTFSGKLH
ncbi:hypothetical protein Hanom_Chr15g01368711 [Helianthus anomalus]